MDQNHSDKPEEALAGAENADAGASLGGVGPTHGLHTAPSRRSRLNCPPRLAVEKPPKRWSVHWLSGPAATVRRICSGGDQI
jgi:hypothetical protein